MEPILNPMLVAILFYETMGMLAMFGAVIVLSTVFIYNVYSARKSAAA